MPAGQVSTSLQDIMDQAMWQEWERSRKRGKKGTTTQLRSAWQRGQAEEEPRSPWSRIPEEEEPAAGPPAIGAEMGEMPPMAPPREYRATRGGGAPPAAAAPAAEEMPLPGELPPAEEEERRGTAMRGKLPKDLPRATRNMLYRAGFSDQDIINLSREPGEVGAEAGGKRKYWTVSGSTLDNVIAWLQQRERAQPKGPWQHPVQRRFEQGPGLRVP